MTNYNSAYNEVTFVCPRCRECTKIIPIWASLQFQAAANGFSLPCCNYWVAGRKREGRGRDQQVP